MKEATGRAPLVGWRAQTLKREHMPAGLELSFHHPGVPSEYAIGVQKAWRRRDFSRRTPRFFEVLQYDPYSACLAAKS
jgi:hypothetical protein